MDFNEKKNIIMYTRFISENIWTDALPAHTLINDSNNEAKFYEILIELNTTLTQKPSKQSRWIAIVRNTFYCSHSFWFNSYIMAGRHMYTLMF